MSPSSVPLNLALPAAAAALAYLDGKFFLSHDFGVLWQIVSIEIDQKRRDRSGQHNTFYTLEAIALNPKFANHPCLIFESRQWTYNQVYRLVLSYGTWLKSKHNVKKDEVIALDCMNRPNFIFLLFGLWAIGAKVALVNYWLTDKSLLHSLKSSTARLVLVDEDVRQCFPQNIIDELASSSFRDNKGPAEVAFFSDDLEQEAGALQGLREPDSSRSVPSGTSMGMLIYTSGTTGLPKPATIQWNKINRVAKFIPAWLGLTPQDRFYTCMPLYHSAASIMGLCSSFATGCTLVLGHRFSTKNFWPAVRESNATVIQYVGETCRYLLSAPPNPLDKANNVRIAFGNGLRPDIWDAFKERFDIAQINEFYGATEGPGGTWNRSRNEFTAGAIGRSGKFLRLLFSGRSALVPHDYLTEAPFRDPKTGFCTRIDTSKPGSMPGELLYKLPDDPQERAEEFPGYYGNQTATSSKVLRNVFAKGDAYFRSGDVVRIDSEGRVYFHDRIGDTFRWKSENVSTNEVSEALGRHPAIAEANVYGVEVPGHDGRAGCACIILKAADGSAREDKIEIDHATLASVAQHVKNALPRYARPTFLRVTTNIETTGTNKQSKVTLRAEGIDPEKVTSKGDQMFWAPGGDAYGSYGYREWNDLKTGKVKL